jgi:hypothetical protein
VRVERGIRRIVLIVSLAAALAIGWYRYSQDNTSSLAVCVDVPAARREFPGKTDVEALTLYHQRRTVAAFTMDGKPMDVNVLSVYIRDTADRQACEWSPELCPSFARTLATAGLYGALVLASVWALFYLGLWIVRGFREAT